MGKCVTFIVNYFANLRKISARKFLEIPLWTLRKNGNNVTSPRPASSSGVQKMRDSGKLFILETFVKALEKTGSNAISPEALRQRVDDITTEGMIDVSDLGALLDDLDRGLSHLNDTRAILECTLGMFGIRPIPLFPAPRPKDTYVDGPDYVSRADVALFLLKLEAYGAPVFSNDLVLSVAEGALSKKLLSHSEVGCLFYARGKTRLPAFECGAGVDKSVPFQRRTFKTGTGRKVTVMEGLPNLWVYIPAQRLRPTRAFAPAMDPCDL